MNLLSELNDKQREAVECTEGPLLILAGAGSGKTRAITYRIAYLIAEKHVDPWNIMAITFTNKAANEMRERIVKVAGPGSEAVWATTFHSSCSRILRRFADRIGYGTNFTIYDTDDSRQAVKDIVKEMALEPKKYPPANIARYISNCKNRMVSPSDCEKDARSYEEKNMAQIYRKYNERLFKNNAFDFDDLLIKTVELFRQEPEVLNYYQERFRYIMVDEYQDTNHIQFEFVLLLAGRYKNICVVGDDDQSIYKFRGADIRNILDFESHFKGTKVIRLEQNYRSSGNILEAANEVIKNNTERKAKELWTENEPGNPIEMYYYDNAYSEASGVVNNIITRSRNEGVPFKDFAILYRTNAQSRLFEETLIFNNIPYRIVGAVNFYSRKEIKDVMAYLKTIDNAKDDVAVKRIINIPKRGIGAASIDRLSVYAAENGISFYEACANAQDVPGLGRAAAKIDGFITFIRKLRTEAAEESTADIIEKVLSGTGYRKELEEENTDEAEDRLQNIDELIGKARLYDTTAETPGLSGFLQEVALVADIDSLDDNADGVVLMTLHSAKGLEFENVFIAGLEDGVFPGFRTLYDESGNEIEEERRLFYVGVTRAKKNLTLSMAAERMMHGETEGHKVSMFVDELPKDKVVFHSSGYRNSSYRSDSGRGTSYRSDGFGGSSYRSDGGRGTSYRSDGFGGSSYRSDSGRDSSYTGSFRKKTSPQGVPGSSFRYRSFDPNDFKVKKSSGLDYAAGDRVRHVKFGEGTVKDIKEGPKDYEVTVEFDGAGVKRLFAAFAKLEKI